MIDQTLTPPPLMDGELALLVRVPEQDRRRPFDDIVEAYAVVSSDKIPGGCIIWGLYCGEWHANVSARWLVTMLLKLRRDGA